MHHGEKFNSLTHYAGGLLASAGAAVLITLAGLSGNTGKIVGASVYGTGLVLVFVASTLYHLTPGPSKAILRKCDHLAIYLMIAGTYTPFCLVTLRGATGYALLVAIWLLAALGMLLEFTLARKTRNPSLVLYLLMGVLFLTVLQPLRTGLPGNGFLWLLAGGFLFLVGVAFYLFDEHVPHFHGIWHLFVIGGSASQYLCVLYCIQG